MRTPLRSWMAAFVFYCLPSLLLAQTELRPGDLAVLGINANLAGCGGGNVDLISFVCFKDITPNTIIDLTDNGYERRNAGQWGNSEGFITIVRTGPTIPAGTVITFQLPDIGSSEYLAIAPDNQWSFTELSTNSLNFNSGGDQLYFLQGGEWDEGSAAVGQFNHDATYGGGFVLFGFNTSPDWTPADDSQSSALHPDVESCFHMEPTGGATDFISYSGPLEPATQLEWIQRISNPANWSSYMDCPSYLPPPAALAILPSGISLGCTVCAGCDLVEETLIFSLPTVGGPFTVEYSDGRDSYTLNGISDGATAPATLTKTTTFAILSVTDAQGCPIFSNFGEPVEVVVGLTPPVAAGARLSECSPTGQATFDLTSLNETINLGSGRTVNWFADAAPALPIDNPAGYTSGPAVVYAVVSDSSCRSAPVAVELTTRQGPAVTASLDDGDGGCSGAASGNITVEVTGGTAPYTFNWNDDNLDGQDAPRDLPAGTYSLTVSDSQGCRDSLTVTISDAPALALSCAESRPVSGANAADGQASVTINGGQAPYQVQWNGAANGTTTADSGGTLIIDNLATGTYTVEVTDQRGCQASCVFTISDPACTLVVAADSQDPSCSGLADGRIELLISGGTAPYTTDWQVDSLDGLTTADRLAAGTYIVTVSDAGGCRTATSIMLTSQFPALSVDIGEGGFTCENDCYGFPVQLRGTPPFTVHYRLPTDAGTVSKTFVTDALSGIIEICPEDLNITTGAIPVTFTALWDANCRINFREERLLTVVPVPITTIDTVLCAGDALVVNGTTYNQDNPSGREVIPGASNSGCDSIVVVDLRFSPRVTATIEGGGTICSGDSTTLTFRIGGASTVDLQYSSTLEGPVLLTGISDGHTVRIAPASSTVYTIDAVVASGLSCPAVIDGGAAVEVGGPALSLMPTSDYAGYNISCAGSADGSLRAAITGGATPYTLAWADGSTAPERSSLPAGTYQLTVTDVAGCSASDSLILTEPDPLLVQFQAIAPSCPSEKDGALIIEGLDGGAAPYAYSVDSAGFQSFNTVPLVVNNIAGGNHTLVIRDANGCSIGSATDIPTEPPLEANVGEDQTIRRGDSLLLSIQTNFPVDSVAWSPVSGLRTPQAMETIARPTATQTYRVTAFDAKGCSASDQVTVIVEEVSRLFAPNAFSPNGDGINDRFSLFGRSEEVESFTLRVFDRWGSILYEGRQLNPNDETQGWDGTARGREAPSGTYLFAAEVEYTDGTRETVKGGIVLLR